MGRKEKNGGGKYFPIMGKANLFYFLYKTRMLLSVPLQAK